MRDRDEASKAKTRGRATDGPCREGPANGAMWRPARLQVGGTGITGEEGRSVSAAGRMRDVRGDDGGVVGRPTFAREATRRQGEVSIVVGSSSASSASSVGTEASGGEATPPKDTMRFEQDAHAGRALNRLKAADVVVDVEA